MKASKVWGFGTGFFVKVKFLSATCHRQQPFSHSPLREPLAHPHLTSRCYTTVRAPGLLRRTSPRSSCPKRHLRTPALLETGTPPAQNWRRVGGNQPNSAAHDNGTGRSRVHLGSGPGEEEGRPAGPTAAAGRGEQASPGPLLSRRGLGSASAARGRRRSPPVLPSCRPRRGPGASAGPGAAAGSGSRANKGREG